MWSHTREESVSAADATLDYTRLREGLSRAVTRVCPGWLADRRDDLVQAAVMRVMQIVERRPGGAQGDGDGGFSSSYLYRVAYSALVDEIRRVRRRRETDLEDGSTVPNERAREDPERAAASREIGLGIRQCLARMKRERRMAVALNLQGHTVPEAARILAWPVKRTENLVYRGLADLRECLTSKGLRP